MKPNLTSKITLSFMLVMSSGTALADHSIDTRHVTSAHQIRMAFKAMTTQESGNKQFGGNGSVAGKDKPTESVAGALGIAQVMPATAKATAKKHHIKWGEDRYKNDAHYNAYIGRLYFEDQLEAFGGDLRKALAAYNAGPGRVRSEIKKHGKDWFSHVPRKTKHYVRINIQRFQENVDNSVKRFYRLTLK